MSYFFAITGELVAPIETRERATCDSCDAATEQARTNSHRRNVANVASPHVSRIDWRELFEERAAIREHDGRMSRDEAEAGALDDLARRWRALHPVAASSDATCGHCGKPEPDLPVLARDGRAWLHRQCWPALDAMRHAQAARAVRDLLEIAR